LNDFDLLFSRLQIADLKRIDLVVCSKVAAEVWHTIRPLDLLHVRIVELDPHIIGQEVAHDTRGQVECNFRLDFNILREFVKCIAFGFVPDLRHMLVTRARLFHELVIDHDVVSEERFRLFSFGQEKVCRRDVFGLVELVSPSGACHQVKNVGFGALRNEL